MKLKCPNGHEANWSDSCCPTCGESFSAIAVYKRTWNLAKRGPLMECSGCQKAFPLSYKECPFCGLPNNVKDMIDPVIDRVRDRVDEFAKGATSKTKRTLQRVYLVVSAVILIFGYNILDAARGDSVIQSCFLSVVYLATLLLLVKWFVPRNLIIAFLLKTTWVVKLALILNYVCLLMLLQIVIATWWQQFFGVGLLVLTTWGGAYTFCRLFWPTALEMDFIFLGGSHGPKNQFNPMNDQGRKSFWDR